MSRAYLQQRQITEVESQYYDLHYVEVGSWRNRLLIPMYDDTGDLTCFQGRILNPSYTGTMKYRTAGPRPIYKPWDDAHGSVLVIVEGPFDLFAVQRVTPAVATLGTKSSKSQITTLIAMLHSQVWEQVAIWYDPDAFSEGYSLQAVLQPHVTFDIPVIVYTDTKDPGECEPEQIRQVLSELRPSTS